jgi:hypothetical protein
MARNRPHQNVTRNRKIGNRGKMPQYNLKWGVEADEEDSFSVSIKYILSRVEGISRGFVY